MIGTFFLLFGVLRMGWVAAFIPAPVMRGFIEGLICVTIIGQVPNLLGIESTPWLIHRLTYHRPHLRHIHVRGYKEKGNINTPLELAICNQADRFSLAIDAIDRMPAFPCHRVECSRGPAEPADRVQKPYARIRCGCAGDYKLAVAVQVNGAALGKVAISVIGRKV